MRLTGLVDGARSATDALRSSPRRVWWTTFALVACLSGLWALANPLFAGPDEPAHVTRAVSVAHGELIGRDATPRERRASEMPWGDVIVRVPAIYGSVGAPCFAFDENATAACFEFSGSRRDTDVVTSAGRHPPAYYAVVGVASWLYRPGSGTVYLMRLLGALGTGAFVATAATALLRCAVPRLVAAGALFAVTPTVLFLSSSVNPSSAEITAALALWVCGLVLLSRAQERVDNRLVTAVGISACVLALSRALGPLWVALIALTIVVSSANRAGVANLARSNWARAWAVLVVLCGGAQLAWTTSVDSFDFTRTEFGQLDFPLTSIVRITFGGTFLRYEEMIGAFGWIETRAPALTYVVWTAGIGLLVLLAVAWCARRYVAAVAVLLAATVLVPVALESAVFNESGGYGWQGRYTLPLAIGVPILAAFGLSLTERGRQLIQSRLVLVIGAALAVSYVLAFVQNLRRYTAGPESELQFWKVADWSPPVSSLILMPLFCIVVVAFVWWMLALRKPNEVERRATAEHHPGVVRSP
jgi:Predicted membrane protein (DUF2142)